MNFEPLAKALSTQRLPSACVDLEAFDRNAKEVVRIARENKKRVRIATKSLRVPTLIKRLLSGAPDVFNGLLLYSCEEIAPLRGMGLNDFVVAYPTVQASDLTLAWRAQLGGARLALVIDSLDQAQAIARSRPPEARTSALRVLVDLDLSWRPMGMHLGVRRSPVRGAAHLRELLSALREIKEVQVVGLMGYEAQVAGLPDRGQFSRALNPVKKWIRSRSMKYVVRERAAQRAVYAEVLGRQPEIFNGAGTGSLNWAAGEAALTELTVGSAFFAPALFDGYSNIRFEPAAFFALTVSRKSDADHVTCLGGGYIASGSPGWERVPVPVWPAGLHWVSAEGAGEVQTPLRGEAARALKPGDVVFFRHAKAGELLERFNDVALVRDGVLAGRASTYRGLGAATF